MLVDQRQMQQVAMLAEVGGQAAIKKLDQNERKAIQVMMEAMQNRAQTTQITLSNNQFVDLTNKLWTGIGSHKAGSSWCLIRFFKGMANIFSFRIASKDLSDQVSAVYRTMPSKNAAEKLKDMVAPLVAAKELTVDYYENKLPKAAILTLLGQTQEIENAKMQFEISLKAEMTKIGNIVGLRDALTLGLHLLFSSGFRGQVSQLAEKFEKLNRMGQAIEGNNIDAIKRELRQKNTSGVSDAIKNYYISIFDDMINLVKEMNKVLD